MQIFQVNINLIKDRPLLTLPQCDNVNRGLTLVRLSEHSTYVHVDIHHCVKMQQLIIMLHDSIIFLGWRGQEKHTTQKMQTYN